MSSSSSSPLSGQPDEHVAEPVGRDEEMVDAFVASQRARRALDASELRLLARASALIDRTARGTDATPGTSAPEPDSECPGATTEDSTGTAGRPGRIGDDTSTGTTGSTGTTRSAGITGSAGTTGSVGTVGPSGPVGAAGHMVATSDTVPVGTGDSDTVRKAREWARRRDDRQIARRSMIAELATATRLSEWTITRMLDQATDLCTRFTAGVDALSVGEISRQHLLIIHEVGSPIENPTDLALFLDKAVQIARTTTTGRLRPLLTAIVEQFREVPLAQRAAKAAERRHTGVRDLSDGLAELFAILPATLAHGIDDRLTTQARAVITHRDTSDNDSDGGDSDGAAGNGERPSDNDTCTGNTSDTDGEDTDGEGGERDTRTFDQIRADVLTDLLLTGTPDTCLGGDGLGQIHATVQITIPVLTMTGTGTAPCLLTGYGPIDPTMAAELAGATPAWERVMTSPVTGAVLTVDRYRPTADLKRFLRARDEHCRFPGCRRPVWRCDIDHTIDAATGGPTSHDNTAHLCRWHHILKHHSAWTVTQTTPGVLVWTSPHGRKHTDRPDPVVRFIPDHTLAHRRRLLREPWLLPAEPKPPPF